MTFYPLEVEYEDDEDECEDEDSPPQPQHHHQYGGRAPPPATVYAGDRAPASGKEHIGRAPSADCLQQQALPVAVSLHEEDGAGSQYTNPGSEEEIKVDISVGFMFISLFNSPYYQSFSEFIEISYLGNH